MEAIAWDVIVVDAVAVVAVMVDAGGVCVLRVDVLRAFVVVAGAVDVDVIVEEVIAASKANFRLLEMCLVQNR